MFLQNVLKALLTTSLAVSGVYATDNNLQEETASFRQLHYSNCYKPSKKDGKVLGHLDDKRPT